MKKHMERMYFTWSCGRCEMKEACLRREKMNNKEDKEMNGLMDSNLKKAYDSLHIESEKCDIFYCSKVKITRPYCRVYTRHIYRSKSIYFTAVNLSHV